MQLDIQKLSGQYQARHMTEDDLPELLALARGNPVYYEHMRVQPALESLREDLTKLPPRTEPEDKYFLGFYRDERLCAALDLILRYPNPETAFIGWFILRKDLQGRGNGTAIVNELLAFLRNQRFSYVRLAYIKGNPESRAFWEKNQFIPAGIETEGDGYTMVVMERAL